MKGAAAMVIHVSRAAAPAKERRDTLCVACCRAIMEGKLTIFTACLRHGSRHRSFAALGFCKPGCLHYFARDDKRSWDAFFSEVLQGTGRRWPYGVSHMPGAGAPSGVR